METLLIVLGKVGIYTKADLIRAAHLADVLGARDWWPRWRVEELTARGLDMSRAAIQWAESSCGLDAEIA